MDILEMHNAARLHSPEFYIYTFLLAWYAEETLKWIQRMKTLQKYVKYISITKA